MPVERQYMKTDFNHGATVQCCPQCQSGMAWDNDTGKHIPADEYAYKHWNGPSLKLKSLFGDSANLKWNEDVCKGNLYRLASMATREVRCLRMFLKDLQEATTKFNGHVYLSDVAEVEALLKEWGKLFRKAVRVAGYISEVKALEGV